MLRVCYLGPVFWDVYSSLSSGGQLNEITGVGGTRLISLDGTQHHSSKTICCPNCRVTVHNEQATYSHNVLLAMLCSPEHSEVLSLSSRFTPWSSTLLADDLHCHQPICELCIQHKMYFIFTCKRDSHTTLYEELDLLKKVEGAIGEKKERRWNGRHYELWHYRWAESLPLRREKPLLVNWCEVTIYHAKTGEQLYYNAWATKIMATTLSITMDTESNISPILSCHCYSSLFSFTLFYNSTLYSIKLSDKQ